MHTERVRATTRTLFWSIVLMVLGAITASAGWLAAPVLAAQRAGDDGRREEALAHYAVASGRLHRLPLGRLLGPVEALIASNELALMYGLHQYDQVIDRAGVIGTPAAQFWAGCALFVKADVEVSDRNRLNWLTEAQQAFRTALESNPADFDARFNYELVGRVIGGMRKDPTAERPRDLQLLTPSSAQAPRKAS